jgi:hypothetical protein
MYTTRSCASRVQKSASPKDNKAAPALRSRSKKTRNIRKKGDDAGNSVPPPHIALYQNTFSKTSSLALLRRFCGVLVRSSKSPGSSVFRVLNSFPRLRMPELGSPS